VGLVSLIDEIAELTTGAGASWCDWQAPGDDMREGRSHGEETGRGDPADAAGVDVFTATYINS
jgi:hypothetical protein